MGIALESFRALAEEDGPYANQARLWTADAENLNGQFTHASAIIPSPDENSAYAGEIWISTGFAEQANALFPQSLTSYKKAAHYAHQTRSSALETDINGYIGEALAWTAPSEGITHSRETTEKARRHGLKLVEQRSLVALAVASAGIEPDSHVEQAILNAETLAHDIQDPIGTLHATVARAWHAAIQHNTEKLATTTTRIEQLAQATGTLNHWADITRAWLPGHTREHTELAKRRQWLDSAEDTMRRRHQLLEDRRALAG